MDFLGACIYKEFKGSVLFMNENIVKAVGEIVAEVTANKKPILTTLTDQDYKDTVEITIDKKARIFVHSQGIKITATTSEKNIELGLIPLSSDTKHCRLDLGFKDAKKAGNILASLK